jgi:CRISPR-associated protein Csm4
MLSRYKIKPVSPVITPLMSDTFFGHFCWSICYDKGEQFLLEFLKSYKEGNPPPVIFSSAFISGYLPRPILPPAKRRQIKALIKKYFIDDPDNRLSAKTEKQRKFEGISTLREWDKQRFISIENWLALKDGYSEYELQEVFYKNAKQPDLEESLNTSVEITASNTINRISGAVMEEGGGLFSREKTWFYPGVELDLYVETDSETSESLVNWFLTHFLPETGFGKDKSTGMGMLDIRKDTAFDPDIFQVTTPNASMALSLSAFDGIGDLPSFYRLKTKFGKLGGDFAFSSPGGGAPKPFKKPILMMEPGSIFFTTDPLNNRGLIANIHSDDRIRHCGLPVTLPLHINEEVI